MSGQVDLEQFIYDALIDLEGYYPAQVAEKLAERLTTAGFVGTPVSEVETP